MDDEYFDLLADVGVPPGVVFAVMYGNELIGQGRSLDDGRARVRLDVLGDRKYLEHVVLLKSPRVRARYEPGFEGPHETPVDGVLLVWREL